MGRKRKTPELENSVKIVIDWKRNLSEVDNEVSILCTMGTVATVTAGTVRRGRVTADLNNLIASAITASDEQFSLELPEFDEKKWEVDNKPAPPVTVPKAHTPKVSPTGDKKPAYTPKPAQVHAKLAEKHGWAVDQEEWLIPTTLLKEFREWNTSLQPSEKAVV